MGYITTKKASEKSGVTTHANAYKDAAWRITGAEKKGILWFKPVSSARFADLRKSDPRRQMREADTDVA